LVNVGGAASFVLTAFGVRVSASFDVPVAGVFLCEAVALPVSRATRGTGISAPVAFDRKLLNRAELGAAEAIAGGVAVVGATKTSWITFAGMFSALLCHRSKGM